MKSLLWIAALVATLPIACVTRQAGSQAGRAQAVFAEVDTSDDEQIDVDEFCEAYFTLAFANLDLDNDAVVTRVEWTTIETADGGAVIFVQLDSDGNGSLTYVEFSTPAERREIIANMFRTLDDDGDGYLLSEEIILVEE